MNFLLVLWVASASAQKIPGAYFRVVPPDDIAESYLLGTDHLIVNLDEFPGDVEKQIGRSKVLRVERVIGATDIDAYAKDPISTMAKMAVFSGPPVDAETRANLIAYGIPPKVAERLSDRDCGVLGAIGSTVDRRLPLEMRIMRVAHGANVDVRAADTDAIRLRAQAENDAAGSKCSLKQLFSQASVAELKEAFLEDARSSVADYRAGKLDEEMANSPIVVSRNLAWMPTLVGDLKSGGAFIAVGQYHLYGTNGLIALLRRRGYGVEEVRDLTPVTPTKVNGTAR